MGLIREDMEPILQKYAGFGYTIYYLYNEGKLDREDVNNIFLKVNPDIASLYLEKVVHKIEVTDLAIAFDKTSKEYPKSACLEEYFGMSNTLITLKPDVYETALNYHYTKMMLDNIRQNIKDVKEQKMLEHYQTYLSMMVKQTKDSVIKSTQQKAR